MKLQEKQFYSKIKRFVTTKEKDFVIVTMNGVRPQYGGRGSKNFKLACFNEDEGKSRKVFLKYTQMLIALR